MALPDLIEVVPLAKPVCARVTVPGSKSITNRALILAALSEGETVIRGALWSEDTQVMTACLQELGFMVQVAPDPHELCNRTITLYGKGGQVPPGGLAAQPLDLFVGNAGTAARFLAAFVCLGRGVYRLHGVPRMDERPQAELFSALRQLGYSVETEKGNDRLPVRIVGGGSPAGIRETSASFPAKTQARSCAVSIKSSSQFASALLLCADGGGWKVEVLGENAEESSYVAMTTKLIEIFPKQGGVFQIEPDASSGTYFLGAGRLVAQSEITVPDWPDTGWQIDERFAGLIQKKWPDVISRRDDLGDGIMTAIVLSAFATSPVRFSDLGRLRLQECERVAALRTELTKCGVKVVEAGDTLTVYPSEPHGAEVETYDDHRMAMCFAILGLKVPGMRITNPACVKKTFPNFFQKLAAPSPQGLGAGILEGRTGRQLSGTELFAE